MPKFTYLAMRLSGVIAPPEKVVVSCSTWLINYRPPISKPLMTNSARQSRVPARPQRQLFSSPTDLPTLRPTVLESCSNFSMSTFQKSMKMTVMISCSLVTSTCRISSGLHHPCKMAFQPQQLMQLAHSSTSWMTSF